MKLRFLPPILCFLIAIFSFSCSTDSDSDTKEPEIPVVKDQYNYIALRNDGTLFSIGDNSGIVTSIGKVTGLEFNTIFNTVTSSPTHTYIYEAWFDPIEGRIFKLNKETYQSEKIILNFPEEFGDNPGIMAMDWDETNQELIGVVRQEFDVPSFGGPIKIVRINPVTFEFTVLQNIDLNTQGYKEVYSSQLIGQKLYLSASKDNKVDHTDLLEIDLNEKTFKLLPQEDTETGLLNLGYIPGTQKLFGFAPILNSSYMGAVRPYVYNIIDEEMEEISTASNISAIQFAHKTFYNSQIDKFIGLIAKEGFSLYSFDPNTNKFSFSSIENPEDLSTMIAIIDAVKL